MTPASSARISRPISRTVLRGKGLSPTSCSSCLRGLHGMPGRSLAGLSSPSRGPHRRIARIFLCRDLKNRSFLKASEVNKAKQNVAVLVDLLQLGLLFAHLRRRCVRSNRNCRYLKNCGQLSFLQVCQQRDLPVRELECIVMSSPPV